MSTIRIEVLSGDYENDDVYENVLNYITNKNYIGGYGFTYDESCSITEQFHLSEVYSHQSQAQKMWHFVITFTDYRKSNELLWLAEHVASQFSTEYQILYGLDTVGHSPHLHFGVNAFSYIPGSPVLSREWMHCCMVYIHKLLTNLYPLQSVTLQFQGKKNIF